MARISRWGEMPDAGARKPGFPFMAPIRPEAPAAKPGPAAGLGALRDRLMRERDALYREIAYIDSHGLPPVREAALSAVKLAESRRTDGSVERAKAIVAKMDGVKARRAEAEKDLAAVKGRLCEALTGIAEAERGAP